MRPRLGLVTILAALLMVGCDAGRDTTLIRREPVEQSFSPPYPPIPAGGRTVRVRSAELSPDGRVVTVTFTGGGGYVASSPCSQDYVPWVGEGRDELVVAVTEVHPPDQATLGPDMVCGGPGHEHTYHLALAMPFHGSTIKTLGDVPISDPASGE